MDSLKGGDSSRVPIALWVHAGAVAGAAAALIRAPEGRGVWVLLIGMVLILWQLLAGSQFAWWVQAVGVAGGLAGLYEAYRRVSSSGVDLSTFFDQARGAVAGVLLVVAAVALLLPATRRYAKGGSVLEFATPGRIAFFVVATFVASIPASVLSAEERLPSEALLEHAEGALFLVGDKEEGIAFYARETEDRVCLIHVRSSGSGMSCDDLSHNPPNVGSVNDDFAGIVGNRVTRVDILRPHHPRLQATVIDDPRFRANFYYLLDGPDHWESVQVVGYDAAGNEVFRRGRYQ